MNSRKNLGLKPGQDLWENSRDSQEKSLRDKVVVKEGKDGRMGDYRKSIRRK